MTMRRLLAAYLGCMPAAAGFASPVMRAGPVLPIGTLGATGLRFDQVRDATRIESDECHANVGCVIDTLRRDYPSLLREEPDLSMFTSDVELVHADSGTRLEGLDQYARLLHMLRFMRNSTLTKDEVTHRIVLGGVACTGGETTIRVRWNAKLWMHDLRTALMPSAAEERSNVQIDGISIYRLNATGFIFRHELESIEVTPSALQHVFKPVWTWAVVGAPSAEVPAPAGLGARFFASPPPLSENGGGSRSEGERDGLTRTAACDGGDIATRQETPMERAARERAEDSEKVRRLSELRSPRAEEKRPGLLGSLKLPRAPESCESNYDCERPLVCCDLVVARVCCSSGHMIGAPPPSVGLQPEPVRVPVDDGPWDGGRGAGAPGGGGNGYPNPP